MNVFAAAFLVLVALAFLAEIVLPFGFGVFRWAFRKGKSWAFLRLSRTP